MAARLVMAGSDPGLIVICQPEAVRFLPAASRRERDTRPADGSRADIIPAVVRELIDALQGGGALADGDGSLALVSRRLEAMFDTIVTSLFRAGLSLQGAVDLPAEMTELRIAEALGHLDDTIRDIRVTAFAARDAG